MRTIKLKTIFASAILCSLTTLFSQSILPYEQWDMNHSRLYPSLAGIKSKSPDGKIAVGSGSILHASKSAGTYILTAGHVVRKNHTDFEVILVVNQGTKEIGNVSVIDSEFALSNEMKKVVTEQKELFSSIFYPKGITRIDYSPSFLEAHSALNKKFDRIFKEPDSLEALKGDLYLISDEIMRMFGSRSDLYKLEQTMMLKYGKEAADKITREMNQKLKASAAKMNQLLDHAHGFTDISILHVDFYDPSLKPISLDSSPNLSPEEKCLIGSMFPDRMPRLKEASWMRAGVLSGDGEQGNSGGPVFSEDRVIGIFFSLISNPSGKNECHYIPIELILSLMKKHSIPGQITNKS